MPKKKSNKTVSKDESLSTDMKNASKAKKSKRTCTVCRKKGHTKRKCPLLNGTTELYKHKLLIPLYLKAKKAFSRAKKELGERQIEKLITSDGCLESFPCSHKWCVVILSDGKLLDFKRMPKDHVSLTYLTHLLGYDEAIEDHLKVYLTYL